MTHELRINRDTNSIDMKGEVENPFSHKKIITWIPIPEKDVAFTGIKISVKDSVYIYIEVTDSFRPAKTPQKGKIPKKYITKSSHPIERHYTRDIKFEEVTYAVISPFDKEELFGTAKVDAGVMSNKGLLTFHLEREREYQMRERQLIRVYYIKKTDNGSEKDVLFYRTIRYTPNKRLKISFAGEERDNLRKLGSKTTIYLEFSRWIVDNGVVTKSITTYLRKGFPVPTNLMKRMQVLPSQKTAEQQSKELKESITLNKKTLGTELELYRQNLDT